MDKLNLIIGNAGIGKTRVLIEEAANNNGIIVCADPDRMYEKLAAYGYFGIKAISYDEFLVLDTLPDKKYYVKNVNELLLKMGIAGCTITTD